MDSVFPRFSLNPEEIYWHDHLWDLTPVEKRGSLLFKREDYFAPLGYGGINGSKLRQLIHLLEYDKARVEGPSAGLLTGSSVMSPQIPMGAAVARHYGMPATVVIGATNPRASIKNAMVQMGAWFEADFDLAVKVAFNPILQHRVNSLHGGSHFSRHFVLEYGITRDHAVHPGEAVLAFHNVGAEQAKNIPPEAKRLIIPAGSCNSATSILHGIAKFLPPNLEEIHLIGIGPSKLRLIAERLKIFQELTGTNHTIFSPDFDEDLPILYKEASQPFFMEQETETRPYKLFYHDLHGTKQVKYHDRVPWEYEGITFHPTYEGKIMRWLHEKRPDLISPENLFWIVGSEPHIDNMVPHCEELGAVPEAITLADLGAS